MPAPHRRFIDAVLPAVESLQLARPVERQPLDCHRPRIADNHLPVLTCKQQTKSD